MQSSCGGELKENLLFMIYNMKVEAKDLDLIKSERVETVEGSGGREIKQY